MKADVTDIKVSLAKIEATLPHIATKAEVEEAKHEATKGKNSVFVSVIALLLSLGALAAKFLPE